MAKYFKATPNGLVPFTKAEEIKRDAEIAAYEAEAPLRLKAQYEAAIQTELDRVAKEKGYDNILSASSYAAFENPFQAEGQAALVWRGQVWATAYAVLAEVEAGTRTIPTVEELLSELPAITWPA